MAEIMIVEDHNEVRRVLVELFRNHPSISVCGAVATAEEALVLLESVEPDLIIIDVSLPRTDGIALLSQIKERRPEQKCVMLSGHAASVYAAQSFEAGALDYIYKDDVYALVPKVEALLA